MATFTVTTLIDENDAGASVAVPVGAGLSLREAIGLANASAGADTITFDQSLNGTIRLDGGDGPAGTAGGTLSVTDEVTIDGDGRITITGDVDNNDVTVGTTDVTDIFATAAAELGDNVRILDATADLTLDGLTLTGGVTSSSGGAVHAPGNTVTLTNTTISGNSTSVSGGGIWANTANLANSTVSGNFANGGNGGGIFAGTANLTNSTVSGNSAVNGGGILAVTADLTNSTVSGNSGGTSGGGISAATIANLTNSIVLGNDAATNDEIAGTVSPVGGLNIVGVGTDTDGGDGVINAASVDAVFDAVDATTGGGQLADNGGPVQTIALKDDAANPAIDAGDDDATGVPATDARGAERADSGAPEGDGDITDLGAFEVTHNFVVTTLDDVVDASDGEMSLREAIDLANGNDGADTITFDVSLNGTIRLDGGDGEGGTVGGTLSVTDEVTIDGDGRILITGDVNDDDTTVGTTDITDIVASQTAATLGDNVRIIDATADLTLDGLSLTGGVTGGSGGAVSSSGTVTLTGSTVSGNTAGNSGGGIEAGVASLTNSMVSGNSAVVGGGIAVTNTATLTNSSVSGNAAAVNGGGIIASTANLTNSTVSGNFANGGSGGGINAFSANLTNSIVSGNSAGISGGGLRATTVTLTDSTVSDNQAGNTGGGILADDVATLTNSTVSGNSADIGGGVGADTATLTNSTVSGNRAEDGNGGGIMGFVVVTLTNSTVSGNSAVDDGGGIFSVLANLTNSIVLGNDAASSDEISGTLGTVAGLNIVGVGGDTDASDGVINASSVDAVFAAVDATTGGGALADNGGPVQTIALKRDLNNPALDKSNNSAPATDARGEVRQDWPGIANQNGSPADLGAYELQNAEPTATNLTQAKTYLEDAASVALDDIVVSDADVGDTITARLTIANPAAGALTTSGAATYNSGTGVWTITGTVAQVNAALAAVAFVPAANFNGDTTIATHIVDAQGTGPSDGTISLDGTPVNDAPVITSNGGGNAAAVQVAENAAAVTTVVATDIDGPAVSYAIGGGADAALFAIDAATGALAFKAAPDFEKPSDAGANNIYEVIVRASDGGLSDTQALSVSVTDIVGAKIIGTAGDDLIDIGHTVAGRPFPGDEGDRINGKAGDDTITGGAGDDTIKAGRGGDRLGGGDGDDVFFGGRGRNVLTGGQGDDTFVFTRKIGLSRITDYEDGEVIQLARKAFPGIGPKGVLEAKYFHAGAEAETRNQKILYDETSGKVLFAKHGSDTENPRAFLKIGKGLGDFDSSDFVVI